jgi:hypothetical protein
MLATLIASVVIGMVIGLRSKVLLIVPATIVAIMLIAVASMALGNAPWTSVGIALLCAVVIQIGYVCGSLAVTITEPHQPQVQHGAAENIISRQPLIISPDAP